MPAAGECHARSRQTQLRALWPAGLLGGLLMLAVGCSQTALTGEERLIASPAGTQLVSAEATASRVATSPATQDAPTAAVAPSNTPAAPPTLAATFDRTSVWSTVAAGERRIEAARGETLCLRSEDVDSDGGAEWVGVYARTAGDRRLGAFVLDGEAWYELTPASETEYGLGEHPVCHLDVRDVNVDGREEILVWGHAGNSVDLLHLFAWNDASYQLVASFEGNAGIRLEESDGRLGEEIVVGHRAGDDLVWEVVYAWDGVAYGWTWDRHRWFYSVRPHVYDTSTPERVVVSFYLALDDRDLPGAFRLLSSAGQADGGYGSWAVGFSTTVGVEASAVREIARNDDGTRSVSAQVLALDNVDGRIAGTLWDVVWTVVSTGEGWRLQGVSSEQLGTRELSYTR